MIQYFIHRESKTIELISGGSLEELRDLYELFKDYKFTIRPQVKESKQGVVIGANYVPIISKIEHS